MKNASDAVVHVAGFLGRELQANRPITTHTPHYPPADSVRGRVLGRLIRGLMMTSGDAWRDLSSSRLAATIHQLRQFGWKIHSHLIIVRTRDHGRDARISEYWLDAAQRRELGDAGRKYAALARSFEDFFVLPTQQRRETSFGTKLLNEFRSLVEFAGEVEECEIFDKVARRSVALHLMKKAAAIVDPVNRLTEESLNAGD